MTIDTANINISDERLLQHSISDYLYELRGERLGCNRMPSIGFGIQPAAPREAQVAAVAVTGSLVTTDDISIPDELLGLRTIVDYLKEIHSVAKGYDKITPIDFEIQHAARQMQLNADPQAVHDADRQASVNRVLAMVAATEQAKPQTTVRATSPGDEALCLGFDLGVDIDEPGTTELSNDLASELAKDVAKKPTEDIQPADITPTSHTTPIESRAIEKTSANLALKRLRLSPVARPRIAASRVIASRIAKRLPVAPKSNWSRTYLKQARTRLRVLKEAMATVAGDKTEEADMNMRGGEGDGMDADDNMPVEVNVPLEMIEYISGRVKFDLCVLEDGQLQITRDTLLEWMYWLGMMGNEIWFADEGFDNAMILAAIRTDLIAVQIEVDRRESSRLNLQTQVEAAQQLGAVRQLDQANPHIIPPRLFQHESQTVHPPQPPATVDLEPFLGLPTGALQFLSAFAEDRASGVQKAEEAKCDFFKRLLHCDQRVLEDLINFMMEVVRWLGVERNRNALRGTSVWDVDYVLLAKKMVGDIEAMKVEVEQRKSNLAPAPPTATRWWTSGGRCHKTKPPRVAKSVSTPDASLSRKRNAAGNRSLRKRVRDASEDTHIPAKKPVTRNYGSSDEASPRDRGRGDSSNSSSGSDFSRQSTNSSDSVSSQSRQELNSIETTTETKVYELRSTKREDSAIVINEDNHPELPSVDVDSDGDDHMSDLSSVASEYLNLDEDGVAA